MTISDINTWARFRSDTDTTSYTAANLLIAVNNAYEEVAALILGCDGRWDWDDTNRTDFPQGTTTLVASQQDYTLDTTYLKLIGVSVKDASGTWYELEPLDPDDITGDRAEFFKTAGRPAYYDKQGQSIILYPAPDAGVSVTLSAGLKVYAQRTADLFTSAQVTTGTKVPGFASPFHKILSLKAALDYCQNYKKDRVQGLMIEIAEIEKRMKEFYSKRDKTERKVLTMKPPPAFA